MFADRERERKIEREKSAGKSLVYSVFVYQKLECREEKGKANI